MARKFLNKSNRTYVIPTRLVMPPNVIIDVPDELVEAISQCAGVEEVIEKKTKVKEFLLDNENESQENF